MARDLGAGEVERWQHPAADHQVHVVTGREQQPLQERTDPVGGHVVEVVEHDRDRPGVTVERAGEVGDVLGQLRQPRAQRSQRGAETGAGPSATGSVVPGAARHHSTSTGACRAQWASAVVLPDPGGATTAHTRTSSTRSRVATSRGRTRPPDGGTRTSGVASRFGGVAAGQGDPVRVGERARARAAPPRRIGLLPIGHASPFLGPRDGDCSGKGD